LKFFGEFFVKFLVDIGVGKGVELKRELVLQKLNKVKVDNRKINAWRRLGNRISAKWDNVSAVEEISQQREKA
jgi:hypothetical protein